MEPRRFPPPWTAEVTPNCFIVRDRSAAKLLSEDEARRIAVNIGTLPDFVAISGNFGAAIKLG
jgi:hypothetical protein